MKIRVAQPFRLVHAGVVYQPGDTADDIPDDVAQDWVRQGWATEVKPAAASRKK